MKINAIDEFFGVPGQIKIPNCKIIILPAIHNPLSIIISDLNLMNKGTKSLMITKMITMIDLIKDSKELGLKDWAEESQDQLVGVDSLTVLKLKYWWDHDNNYFAFHLNIYLFFSFFPKTICGGVFLCFFCIHKANFRSVCGG